MDKKTKSALTRVKNAGIHAQDYVILCWIKAVSADTVLQTSLREIRSVAGCF